MSPELHSEMRMIKKNLIAIILGVCAVLVAAGFYIPVKLIQVHDVSLFTRKEVKELTRLVESGDADACWCLSWNYMEEGEPERYWLRKAADSGHPKAEYRLYSILKGQNKDQNKKAFELLRRSAEQNDAFSENELGEVYHKGEIVTRDFERAEYWYRRAANAGSAFAMFNLSKVLLEVKNDKAAIIESYKWSAIAMSRTSAAMIRIKEHQVKIIKRAEEMGLSESFLKNKTAKQVRNALEYLPNQPRIDEDINEISRGCLEKIGVTRERQ
jgi:hypothetical protein